MKRTKEFSGRIGVALVMTLAMTSTVMFQRNVVKAEMTNDAQESQFTVQNGKGEDVTVVFEEPLMDVREGDINDILASNPDAECITFYEVGYPEEECTPAPAVWDPPVLHSDKYETDKTITVPERRVARYFLTSVAKGEKDTLGYDFTKTLEASISGSFFDKANLGLKGSVTAHFSATYEFSGPPEKSKSNSRSYYADFYQEDGTYVQRHYVYHWPSGDLYGVEHKSGSFTQPTRFEKYSVDNKVK